MRRWKGGELPADDPRHGTENGYNYYGCKCVECKAAWAEAALRKRARRRRALPTNPDVEHGNPSTYINHECRCTPCTDAHTAERNERARTARIGHG